MSLGNGKISYRLYPKRKDFVSLNVAIKNLAVLQGIAPPQKRRLSFFLFQSNTRKYTCLAQHVHFYGFLVTKLL